MSRGPLISMLVASVLLLAIGARAEEPPGIGHEATRSRITVVDLDGGSPKVVLDAPRRYAAPEWTPDGAGLVVNGGGRLWRLPASGGAPAPIPIATSGWIDINHAVSPDGRTLAFTSGAIWKVPIAGGSPVRITPAPGNWLHAWSPDGRRLAFSANRGRGLDVFAIPSDGGSERRLTTSPRVDDAPQYSPDGRWIYFVSDRAGTRDIWRIPADGAGPVDDRAEPVTADDREDVSPHPSPDGRWLVYLSYPPRTAGNAMDRDAMIRRLPIGDVRARPRDVARVVGGHGTLGARPFAPDGRRFTYASFEPPPPAIRIVLLTASDRSPPAGAPRRLSRIADAAERFLLGEMRRWEYPPAVSRLFRRGADGSVEVLSVKGAYAAADLSRDRAVYAGDAIRKAERLARVEGEGHIWWVFYYVGDRPERLSDWRGVGCSRDGGFAIVNYDTIPGEIRPDLGLQEGFNAAYFLKGTVHELGHALGLPHIGPDPALGRGNSLMGANADVYVARKQPHADRVYLTEASAAMLWKHPVFSGTAKDRQRQPVIKLADYKPTYSRASDRITLAGKVVSDPMAHSVVVLDDLGRPSDEYWCRSHVARVAPDGTFRVAVDHPARADGHFRILFCFDNGVVTGDGAGVVFGDRGDIRKSYHFRDGGYRFGD